MIKKIKGDIDLIESLRGKKATFLLSMSNTKTANIKGITQAGIDGLFHLTPTLDSEFVALGEVRSLKDIAQTPKGVPTPAIITRSIHLLKPFSNIEFLDLGLEIKPDIKHFKIHSLDIKPSESIETGANIDAESIFEKGIAFGQNYQTNDDYIILAESVPAGTTTALATSKALNYDCEELFSSSFKNNPNNIKKEVVKKALENIKNKNDFFDKLGAVSDNMIIFNAGFILGLNNRIKLILAGGTQMASVLLLVNSILKEMNGSIETSNLAICTTKWVYEDGNSDIEKLLDMLDFPINFYISEFDFSLSSHPALKLYDDGEAKEGVGAGASLVYASLNGLDKNIITKKIEDSLS